MQRNGMRFFWSAGVLCASWFGLTGSAQAFQVEQGQAEPAQTEQTQAEQGQDAQESGERQQQGKWLFKGLDGNQNFFVIVDDSESTTQVSENEAPKHSKYWLGISLKPIDGDLAAYLGTNEGVLVDSVYPESPAEQAGLKKGDILTDVNGDKLAEPRSLMVQMAAVKAAEDGKVAPLKLTVLRKGETVKLELTPAERPAQAAIAGQAGGETENAAGERKVMTIDLRGKTSEEIEKMVEGGLRVFRLGQPAGWKQSEGDGEVKMEIHRENHGKKLEVSIIRDGEGPAKVTVKRDGKTEEFTTDKMGEMPEDIRKIVQDSMKKDGRIIIETRVEADGERKDAKSDEAKAAGDGAKHKEHDGKQSKQASESRTRIAIVGPEGLDLNIGEFMKGEAMHKELAEKYRAMAEEIADRAQQSAFWARDAAAVPQEMKALQSQVEALRAEVEELRQQLKQKEKETTDK